MNVLRSISAGLMLVTAVWATASLDRPRITSPRDGSNVRGPIVVITGTSDEESVRVSGIRGTEQVFSRPVQVRDGRWETSARLELGSYVIKVEDKSGNSSIDLKVGRGAPGGGGTIPVDRLRLDSPRNGSTLGGPKVTVSGYAASGRVDVQIDQGKRRVYSGRPTVRNGRWSVDVRLDPGSYVASAQQDGRRERADFKVRGETQKPFINVLTPRNGGIVIGTTVRFDGTSSTDRVTVSVFSGNRRVSRTTVDVDRGKWSWSVQLDPGSYRVSAEDSGMRSERTFTVKGNKR
ncbi:MAG: hypothetical protein JST30_13830 [Armatimonadetes bacterium]|nr:hypothetical protein [Armatimonadota bacterium]